MRLRIITVGSRQPSWVEEAVADYLKRFRTPWRVELVELEAVPRTGGRSANAALEREGERVLTALRERERVILLDETGKSLSTREFARSCAAHRRYGWACAFCPSTSRRELVALEDDIAARTRPRDTDRAALPGVLPLAGPPLPSRLTSAHD